MKLMIGLLSILGVSVGSALAAQEASLVGHWKGAIVVTPAELEMDVEVDFSRTDAQVKGQLWFPITTDGAHALENLVVQGSHVSFSVHDKDGVVSAFEGALAPDNANLLGTMKENGKLIPFTLHRAEATALPLEVPISKLSGDGMPLKTAFNNDVDKTRILLLLNLGSFSSRVTLRLVERFVMDQIDDPNLRVYAVWMAPDVPEAAKVVRQEAALATDARITRFWSTDRSLANIFAPMLAPYQPVSNPCLLFAPGRSWVSTAPTPDRVRGSRKSAGKGLGSPIQKFNGLELAADVQLLLSSRNGH